MTNQIDYPQYDDMFEPAQPMHYFNQKSPPLVDDEFLFAMAEPHTMQSPMACDQYPSRFSNLTPKMP
jgi:hypothetical protein